MESVRMPTQADVPQCAALLEAAFHEILSARGGRQYLESGAGLDALVGDDTAVWVSDWFSTSDTERREPPSAAHSLATRLGGRLAEWTDPDPAATRRLFVCEFEGSVVGLAAGVRDDRNQRSGPIGRILGCYVDAQARDIGVGSALVKALLLWFDEQGCTCAEAVAFPGDRSTKQLFELSGFKARLLVMHRDLPAD